MTVDELTYHGHLIACTCWCGIRLAVPAELYRAAKTDTKQGIHCPLGHRFVYRRSAVDEANDRAAEAEAELAAERARRDQAEAAAREAVERTRVARDEVARTRRRAVAGVCPCCSRSFTALARHMATKHPDYRPSADLPDIGRWSLVDAVTVVLTHADEPLTAPMVHGRLVLAGRSDTASQVAAALYNAQTARGVTRVAPGTWTHHDEETP